MDELLKKLLEAEVLSPETKSELETAFKRQLNEAIETAKHNAAADVRAELTAQWVTERDALVEAIDTKVGDFLDSEIGELKTDIERFRDLEAEQAEKLIEAKAEMATELQGDLKSLVEKIDAFLEIRLAAEIDELREDLDVVKRNEFGRKLYEAFAQEFAQKYVDEDSTEASVGELTKRLQETSRALETAEERLAEKERSEKLAKVLAPLSGRSRDVMEAILNKVDTDQLEEGYKTFIGRVIRESEATSSEKESSVLAEGASDRKPKTRTYENARVKTGDTTSEVVTEGVNAHKISPVLASWKRLAGIE